MSGAPPEAAVTEADVGALLQRLKVLRQQVAEARAALAPMEANLALAAREYQDEIRPLRREAARVQAQIYDLQDRIRRAEDVRTHLSSNQPVEDEAIEMRDAEASPIATPVQPAGPDTVEKDKLLEHVYRVLDPMINPADAELVGQLQGLCTDNLTRLADVLEQIQWGPIWEEKSSKEALASQYHRLRTWESALVEQLALLNRGAERLRADRRYGLWLQREKGPEAWQGFLEQAAVSFRSDIADLQMQLEVLQKQWKQLMDGQ